MTDAARSRSLAAWAALGVVGLAAFALFRAWMPSGPSTCLLYVVAGIPCPGCGMTRACSHLARGELRDSLRLHPLAIAFAAQALVAWAWWGLVLAGRARVPSPWIGLVVLALDTVALPATWLVRMAMHSLPR